MALVIEVFGTAVLDWTKVEVVKLIRETPLIADYQKDAALKEWSEATDVALNANDFAILHEYK